MKTITFNIRKPLYGSYVYLRGSLVEKAIRTKAMLDITIPAGRVLVDPNDWKATGKMMKKEFKFKNNPMILYGNFVNVELKSKGEIITPEKKKKSELQLTLF